MASLSIQSASQKETLEEFAVRCAIARQENKQFCERLDMAAEAESFRDMTPQEKLFMKFYQGGYSEAVQCESLLEMRAKREGLKEVAQNANAKMRGYDKAIDEEEKKGRPSQGFSRSLNVDDTTSDAINAVKRRGEKLSKGEKLLKSLVAAGMSEADAIKTLSAGSLLNTLRAKGETKTAEELRLTPEHFDKSIDEARAKAIEESKVKSENSERGSVGFFNPFEKKE